MSVRLWTGGFNIYHPNRAVLYHYWDRSKRATHFSDHAALVSVDSVSKARVRSLLGIPRHPEDPEIASFHEFGLGVQRSIKDYEAWSGVDFATLGLSQSAKMDSFPVGDRVAVHSSAHVLLRDEEVVVVDDFLPQEQYDELRDFLVCSDYKHINTEGVVARAWHLQDRFPLRSESSWISKLNQEGGAKPDWVLPTGKPIDRFMQAVETFQAANVPQIGKRGVQWDEFSATSWIYPPGTGLAMHTDGVNVYAGAYVYFLNNTWRSHWGGLLIVMNSAVNQYVEKHERAEDGMLWYRRRWLYENRLESLLMEGGGLGRVVFPKANRIVFLGNKAYHMVTRINEEAGDVVRLSLAGFFSIPKAR